MLDPSRYPPFDPLRISTAFLNSGYRTLKVTEATVFALAPLPLQQLKTGIQQVAVPLLVTAAASRLPGVDHFLTSGIHAGGQFLAAGGKAIAAQGLHSFGQAVSHHLPSGFGVRALAEGMGQAITPVVLGGVERGGQGLGELTTAVLSGRTLLNAGQQAAGQIGDKGIQVYIGDTIANTQAAISKAQQFLAQAKHQVSTILNGEFTMAPRKKNNTSDNSIPEQNPSRNDARVAYVKLVQDGMQKPSLTYDQMVADVKLDPKLGELYDRIAMNQAQARRLSPEVLTTVVAQGAHVQALLNSGKQQNVSGYLADLHSTYLSRLNPQQASQKQEKAEAPEQTIPQQQPEPKAHVEATSNGKQPDPQTNGKQPEAEQLTSLPDLEAKPALEPKAPVPKSSREAEDYALGIVQMLDQRRLNVDRFQIDVNGQTVFKMQDGDINQKKTSISQEHTELIKKALSDPASLNGSVKISQGNQVLLHVKDGRVLIDAVGLTKQSAKVEVKTPESPSEGLFERFSKEAQGSGLQATQEIASQALQSGVKREQVLEMLKAHDPSYQRLVQAQGEKGATQMLEKLVTAAEAKLMQQTMPHQQQTQEMKAAKSMKV
jgi:hypothetical protein